MAKLARVEIQKNQDGSLTVAPIWEGVDRPYTGGYNLSASKIGLANRLKAAIESGKVWLNTPSINTDVNGQTYVSADIRLSMRRLSAELTRTGF